MQCIVLVRNAIELYRLYKVIDENYYSYELQIEKEYQRKGLGRFFINALERMAKHYNMEKLILTVLSNNEDGIKFFNNVGFVTDDTSPSPPTDYSILSKNMICLHLESL